MEIQKLSGEELAQALNQSYQQLLQAQQNIVSINTELERRKVKVPEVVKE